MEETLKNLKYEIDRKKIYEDEKVFFLILKSPAVAIWI